jgi:hypothetical protein
MQYCRDASAHVTGVSKSRATKLLQLGVLGFGGDEYGNVGVGVLSKREEISICR